MSRLVLILRQEGAFLRLQPHRYKHAIKQYHYSKVLYSHTVHLLVQRSLFQNVEIPQPKL